MQVSTFTETFPCSPRVLTQSIFAVPHIGHLHSVVIADIFARHARLSRPDRPVHFMTGTDEHGLKIQKAARERGLDPLVFCDELSTHFRVSTNIRSLLYQLTQTWRRISPIKRISATLAFQGLLRSRIMMQSNICGYATCYRAVRREELTFSSES